MDMELFFEKLLKWGLEWFNVYYGIYRGIVTNNQDPDQRGRIQAAVPAVGLDSPLDIWIDPSMPLSGPGRGLFFPPEIGDGVWVWFRNGNSRRPYGYMGGWYAAGELSEDLPYTEGNKMPERRGILLRKGHRLLFNEEEGKEYIKLIWHQEEPGAPVHSSPQLEGDLGAGFNAYLSFDENGTTQLTNKDGSIFELNGVEGHVLLQQKDGNVFTVDKDGFVFINSAGAFASMQKGKASFAFADGITLMGKAVSLEAAAVHLTGSLAVKSAVLGEDLVAYLTQVSTWVTQTHAWLLAHIHPTPAGPSSPATPPSTAVPPPPPPPTILSKKVKLS